ncbi:hypothetical protein HMPREF0645_1573 [Hallella bergensis DSM 17361]|uniref:Uncharacterized protein n=1 Tax=Hallella bergensis DSM 17361 TaxID=585502 RepID=D1PX88_9BACT|nr:hypothetical protein HMPREF0645_1573 [Hallella bergensis DSM 17361]
MLQKLFKISVFEVVAWFVFKYGSLERFFVRIYDRQFFIIILCKEMEHDKRFVVMMG